LDLPSCINGGLIVGIRAIPGGMFMGFTLGGCDAGGASGGRIKCAAGSVIGGCMVGGTGWAVQENFNLRLEKDIGTDLKL
jgi:hypothetical protein